MSLTARQTKYYTDTVSVYKPAFGSTDSATKLMQDVSYTLVAASIKCKLITTPEDDTPSSVGRTKTINLFTYDKWHFDAGQEIGDAYAIVLTASGNSRLTGGCWICLGNAQIKYSSGGRQANYAMVYSKRAGIKPTGVS